MVCALRSVLLYFACIPGDGRLERYAVSRLKSLIFEALCLSAAALGAADDLGYSPDGGLVSFGEFDYVYDSASRLTEVWSNGAKVVENRYDALGRRVVKRTPEATHTFVYDGWLLVVERIERSSGILDQIDYWWGKDISGTLDGAGGIGGLLYIRRNGSEVYVPLYDGHGNVMQYVDKQGTIVASYAHDAFGNIIQQGGAKTGELRPLMFVPKLVKSVTMRSAVLSDRKSVV